MRDDPARAALAELVRLKDGPRDEAYERDKITAWETARRIVSEASLAGVSEVAEILGVSKLRANQLAATAAFPAPIVRLAATPVWRREDVEAFGRERKQ